MKQLTINKGYKEYSINGDENAVIRVKTTDFSLIDRLFGVKEKIASTVQAMEQLKDSENTDAILESIKKADIEVKQELDRVFDFGVSEVVCGDMNSLSFAGGQPVALNFLEAIIPEIKKDLEAEQGAAQKRIDKYTETAKQFK